jgi:STE24 endopeptidase
MMHLTGSQAVRLVILCLVLAKWGAQLWLDLLNRRYALTHAAAVPEEFRETINPAEYSRSIQYTLARSTFHLTEISCGTLILLGIVFSGVLPTLYYWWTNKLGVSTWAMGAFLFVMAAGLSLLDLPLDWYRQFRLEEKFGFNTTTLKTWWLDRVKGLLLALALGYPLIVLILNLVKWTGAYWWLWAWGAMLVFQLLMFILAPVLILPLFNKFAPLPEGTLKQRLLDLAQRARFAVQGIRVMDGSKRSRHSNAFFTGIGRFKKIVFFDTLIEQLAEVELEAVLAHEIGHYKKKHIPRMLIFSAIGSLAGFYLLSWLASQEWFFAAFGFQPGNVTPALLLFALLSGVFTFWLSPALHWLSRRHEYQADAFAAEMMSEPGPLITALRKLNQKNLSNLLPHPLYSGFYYSHPTLLERERSLRAHGAMH